MLKRLLGLLLLINLTGCPYTEGCQALPSAEEKGTEIEPTEPAPVDPSGTDAGTADSAPPSTVVDGGKGGLVDFGPAPTGAVALSALSCPELAMPLSAATVYVDANAGGTENGTKAAPFRTVGMAFAKAAANGVIYVAAGTYKENLSVPDKNLVVFGGFARGFASRTNACATVLEAANASKAVLTAAADVKSFGIEGVTVQKGARGLVANGDSSLQSTFTIARCVFANNGTKTEVGGAAALDRVNARVFRSVFRDNIASKGAAIANGGDVSLTVDQNLFDHNLGYSDHGGGLYLSAKTSTIARNTFRGNATAVETKGGWGGAVIVYSNSLTQRAKADFSFNVFTENTAGIGGAVFVDDGASITMSHDLVYRNRAYPENGFIRGAALYVDGTGAPGGGSTLVAEYLTVVNNNYDDTGAPSASTVGGNVYVESYSKASFANSIFWNNGQNAFYAEANNEISVTNSIGATGCTTSGAQGFVAANANICKMGEGVFEPAEIYFGDESADDYHEKSTAGRFSKGAWVLDAVTSPAIDKADPRASIGTEPMPNGGRANLGAFAGTNEASMSP
jgi:hypothetical protein